MTADHRDLIDREIVLCRVIDAPVERVFAAWADPARITAWFGPEGFTCETSECDIREGGRWRFVYTGPDGTRWSNRVNFVTIAPPRLIAFEHGADTEDDPNRFHVNVTFDAQANGKTVLTLRQLHPSAQRRNAVIGFGAVEYGYQTLDKLARHAATP